MFEKKFNTPITSNNSFRPTLDHITDKRRLKFDGSCLKQDKLRYPHIHVVNILLCTRNLWSFKRNCNFTLTNPLFKAAKLTY